MYNEKKDLVLFSYIFIHLDHKRSTNLFTILLENDKINWFSSIKFILIIFASYLSMVRFLPLELGNCL